MGKKGHFNYSDEVKTKVVVAREEGKSFGQISKELQMPRSTAMLIYSRFKARGTVESHTKFNKRPSKTDEKIDRYICKKAPHVSLNEMMEDLKSKGVELSKKSITRRLKESNVKRLPVKKGPKPAPKNKPVLEPSTDISLPLLPTNNLETVDGLKMEVQRLQAEVSKLQQTLEMKDFMLNQSKIMCYSCNQLLTYPS